MRKPIGFVALLIVLCVLPLFAQRAALNGKQSLNELKIYDSHGERYVAWKSSEAVKFSLDQVVTSIRYLFAAAAAGMAFVGKIVIEPRVNASAPNPLPPFARNSLITTVVFWIASTVGGMFAHLYLAEIGTMESFSIFHRVGIYVGFQLGYFAIGLVLFLVALVRSV